MASMLDFEPLCHYPAEVPVSEVGDASCLCQQDRSDDDASWILQSAFTVLSMQAGFALLEAGSVTELSVTNIMIKNMSELGLGGALYFLVGYAITYGGKEEDHNPFCACSGNWALSGVTDHTNFLFSFSFAMSTATIISGAVAERIDFWAYLTLSCFYTNFVYPTAAYWTWGPKGWLNTLGMMDFAGGGCVHIVGGTGAFVAAMWIGPRLDRFSEDALRLEMNDPTSVLWGTFVLWLGWFGFTSGSSLGFSGADGVGAIQVSTATALAGAFGLVGGLAYSYAANHGHIRVEAIATSLLSALVSITPVCAWVQPWEAAIIGFTGALTGVGSCRFVDWWAFRLQLDDPVQAIGVHFSSGIWGMLCVGLFTNPDYCGGAERLVGLFHGGGFKLLGLQVLGIVSMVAWSASCCLLLLTAVHFSGRYRSIRISEEDERAGLDLVEHGVYNRRKEMMERVGELSAVMRDLDLIDVTPEERDEALGQLQSVMQGDAASPLALQTQFLHGDLASLPAAEEGDEAEPTAPIGEQPDGEPESEGRANGEAAGPAAGGDAGTAGNGGGPRGGEESLDGTTHSQVSHASGGRYANAGGAHPKAVHKPKPMRRVMTSRYAAGQQQQREAAQRARAELGLDETSHSSGGKSLASVPEEPGQARNGGAQQQQQQQHLGETQQQHLGGRPSSNGGGGGVRGEREREREKWEAKRAGLREEEAAVERAWKEAEEELGSEGRAVQLLRREIALLRERCLLAEAEVRSLRGGGVHGGVEGGGGGKGGGEKKRLTARAASMLGLRIVRDRMRDRFMEAEGPQARVRRHSIHEGVEGPGLQGAAPYHLVGSLGLGDPAADNQGAADWGRDRRHSGLLSEPAGIHVSNPTTHRILPPVEESLTASIRPDLGSSTPPAPTLSHPPQLSTDLSHEAAAAARHSPPDRSDSHRLAGGTERDFKANWNRYLASTSLGGGVTTAVGPF